MTRVVLYIIHTDIVIDIIIESLQSLANPHLVFCLGMINIDLEEANMHDCYSLSIFVLNIMTLH